MFISHLTLTNFKGHSTDHDLAPVTLIVAGNFRHKTAVPLAIRLGMAGYLPPPLGVRAVYKLAGNPTGQGQMGIMLRFDNGREQAWKWVKDAAGSVSVTGGLSPDIAMPELMLDPRLFWGKTQAERVQTIFSVCELGADVFSPNAILNRLSEVQASPVAYCEAALGQVQKRIGQDKMTNIQDWIERLLDWLNTEAKLARDAAKGASGAFKAFKAVQTVGMPKDRSAELTAVRQELQTLETTLLSANADGFRVQLEHVREKLTGYSSQADYEAVMKEMQAVYESCPIDEDETPEDVLQDLASVIETMGQRVDACSRRIDRLKAEATELANAEACPTCKNNRKGWKKERLAEIEAHLAEELDARTSAESNLAPAVQRADTVKAWNNAAAKLPQIQAKITSLTVLQQQEKTFKHQIAAIQSPPPETITRITTLKESIGLIESQQLDWSVYQKDRERKEVLETQLLREQCRAEVFKGVAQIVGEEQRKLIDSSFRKVLNVAQHFTTGLINSPLEFVDGELGRRVTQADIDMDCEAPIGSWIPFETFSGTEELLALAGFGVALTGDAPVKLVILDEMGRLESKRRVDVALRMLSLVESGIIDQAILIDVDAKVYVGLQSRPTFKIITP